MYPVIDNSHVPFLGVFHWLSGLLYVYICLTVGGNIAFPALISCWFPWEPTMSCPSCGSENKAEFAAEMIVHFAGLENVDEPGVWVFPKLLVCLDCGFSQLTVPKSELALLARDTGAKGASAQ